MLWHGLRKNLGVSGVGIVNDATESVVRAEGSESAVRSVRVFRSTDPIDVLSRRLDDVCTRAVDPWQIAAALEADGMGDRMATEHYDRANVFALAEDLYHRVPLRVSHRELKEDPDEAPAWRDLSRGLLFVLPGALYIAAVHGFASLEAAYALLLSLIFAWVWGQGSGYLGHILIGRQAAGAARRLVLTAAVVGVVFATLLSLAAVFILGLSVEIIVVTAVQTTYLLAASVLLLFRKEHVLFAILIPGVVLSGLITFGIGPFDDDRSAAAVVVATVLVVAVAAVVATQSESDVNPAAITKADVVAAIPHMALGLTWASLVSFSALVTLDAAHGAPSIGVTILPLLLSMGVAEWSLRRYLKQSRQALEAIEDPGLFAAAARGTMWSTVGGYTLVMAVFTVGAAAILAILGELAAVDMLMMLAFGQLGAAFLLGQILASRFRLGEAVAISIASVVVLVALIMRIDGGLGSASLEVAYFGSTLFLALMLLIRTRATVGKATTYQ